MKAKLATANDAAIVDKIYMLRPKKLCWIEIWLKCTV